MINFRVNLAGLDDLLQRLTPDRVAQAIKAMTTGLARLLLRFSQMGAPVATGNLRRSGFMMVDADGLHAIVGYGSHYAGVVESGSVAHEIAARNVRTLAFIPTSFSTLAQATTASQGSRLTGQTRRGSRYQTMQIFPQHILHPGTTADPFLVQGWEDSKPEAELFLGEVGSHFIKGEEQDE